MCSNVLNLQQLQQEKSPECLMIEMSSGREQMVRLKFEVKNLSDTDYWTKSDPYLCICRPARTGDGKVKV